MSAQPIIRANDVKVIYNLGKSNEYHALRGETIDIYPQEYIILFGPSGCGKSTLLYAFLGIQPPTMGEILVKNENPYKYTAQQMVHYQTSTIGIIYQAFNLIPSLSILDNVALPLIFKGMSKSEREKRAHELLKRFGIDAQYYKLPTALSGGQMQRVAVARSLVCDPEILLGDEPVGNLDSVSSDAVMNTLNEINTRDKKTIILVTHDAKFLPYAHRVYFLKDGRVEREVVNPEKPQIKKVAVGTTILTEVEKLARIYPYATREELRVKSIVNYVTQNIGFDQLERLEKLTGLVIHGSISDEDFLTGLTAPYEQGGVDLPRATAEKIVTQTEKIMDEARDIRRYRWRAQAKEASPAQKTRIEKLRTSLLDLYPGQVTIEQLQVLEQLLEWRVSGIVTMEEFERRLQLPLVDGGVAIASRDAREMSRYLEKLIAQGIHFYET